MGLTIQKVRAAVAVLFLILIGVMSFANKGLLKKPVSRFILGKTGFRKTTEAISSFCSSSYELSASYFTFSI